MAKVVRALLLVAAAIGTAAAQVPASRSTPLFDVTPDDFWLNLHHYLYVIGRARTGAADARQPGVASAPEDEERGRAALTDAERALWMTRSRHMPTASVAARPSWSRRSHR